MDGFYSVYAVELTEGREECDEDGGQFYTRIGCGDAALTAAECAAAGGAWRAKATTEAECDAYGYECFASDDSHYVGPHGPMANRTARVPDPSFSPQQCSNAERTAGICHPSMVDVPLCPSCLPHWSRRRALAARPYDWSPGVYQRNRWMADGLQWVSRGAASKAVT